MRKGNVVEPDERNVARDFESGIVNRAQGADRREVVRGDYRGRRLLQAKQIAHRRNSTLDAMIALFNQFRLRIQAARLHSCDEGFESSFRGLQVKRPRDESNAFMV